MDKKTPLSDKELERLLYEDDIELDEVLDAFSDEEQDEEDMEVEVEDDAQEEASNPEGSDDDEEYSEDDREDQVATFRQEEAAEGHYLLQYSTRDSNIQWSKVPLAQKKKIQSSNILKKAAGFTRYSSTFTSKMESFLLFVTPNIINKIVVETNRKAQDHFHKWNSTFPDKHREFRPTNAVEIQAYFGLLLTLGALKSANEPITMLWTSDPSYCRPVIPACLSKTRFKFLTRFVRFDNFETRSERRKTDKLAPIREVFDEVVHNCKKAYNPGTHLCVDEQLVGFRGRCPFRIYMKSKPDKYGIKIWALADCESAYVSNMQVYLGKQGGKPEKNQGKRVVLDLTSHIPGGRGITTDNFFTSLELSDELLKRKLTLCGTVRKNKAFIPNDLLPKPYKPVFSSMFAFRERNTLVSYVPKKGKSVILLSSEHFDDTISTDKDAFKPEIILHYNRTKGAIDTDDKLSKQYSCIRKSNRWPMAIFGHLLDISAINAFKLWKLKDQNAANPIKLDERRTFLLDLGKELMKDHMLARYEESYIPIRLKNYISDLYPAEIAEEQKENQNIPGAVRGRCYLCARRKDTKTRKMCSNCSQFVCTVHSQQCLKCSKCK